MSAETSTITRDAAGESASGSVCVVGPGFRFLGGLSVYTCRLANALADSHRVSVIRLDRLTPTWMYPGGDRVGAALTGMSYRPEVDHDTSVDWHWMLGGQLRRVWRHLRRERPEVLVLQWWTAATLHSYLAMAVMARRLGIPVVLEFHELQDPGEAAIPVLSAYRRLLMPALLRLATGAFVHNEHDRRLFLDSYRARDVEHLRIEVAPHGPYDHLPTDSARAARPERDRADPGVTKLLFFGLIRPYKGLEDLIEAFDRLTDDEAATFSLTVVGETWENWTKPAEAIAANRHRDRITFVNRYVTDDEAAAYFADADAIVLPYRRGSASGPLQIAMSCGIHVIMYGVGGLVEAVGDYEGANVLPADDLDALHAALLGLTGRAQERFDDIHTWDANRAAIERMVGAVGGTMSAVIAERATPLTTRRERAAEIRRPRWWAQWTTLIAAAAVGTLFIAWSYRLSALGAPSDLYYVVFWVGMLVAVLPAAGAMIARSSSSSRRVWALVLLAYITAVPKFLRNPFGPLYHDEYAHWRQATDVISTGQLGLTNDIIPIVQFFPGTSAVTVGLAQLTGLSVWNAGILIVFVTHVLALVAALVLVGAMLGSVRAGAVGALVYALNPSWLYFDTQYAYESVAIAYYLWVLAFAALAAREPVRRRRWFYASAGVLVAGAAVVTHHLTTLALIGTLMLISGAVLVTLIARRRQAKKTERAFPALPEPAAASHPAVWWGVTLGTTVIAATWLLTAAWLTILYLSPYAGTSVQQLGDIATDGDGGRELLAASVQPLWERGLSALAPVIVGLVCLSGVWILWKERRRWPADVQALALFGLVYFPSVLFIVAPMGAEGARRSWAFTYIGVALIVALVHQRKARSWGRRLGAAAQTAIAAVVVAVLLIGNVGAGLNDPYRFPGPFRWGTDTNSASMEARAVGELLGAQAGRVRIVSDRYTRLPFSAFGGIWVATPSFGFPAAQLVQTDEDPSVELATMLATSQIDYLVVDTRIAEEPAYNGDNFGSSDPLPGRATPNEYLDRLDHVEWASLVMTTEHVRVYRLDMTPILEGQQ